jgi:hypothetical protein
VSTAKELAERLVEISLQQAALRIQRDQAIVREYKQGRRPVDLARETGLTRGRIAQITEEKGK